MRYLDVCAGISASTVAWAPLGWKAAAYSEIEPAPRAILAHHYPDTPLHGDFTTIQGHEYGAIDLLVGGTPCQDFSVAGLRAGLDGERGNLSLEYLRLADRARPRWLVWENVPGVLSIAGGRAFGAILGGLGQLGYGFAFSVLDAQYFGVPQRRRRVFVVGYLGDWRPAAAVLFERHSLSGYPAPRREAWQGSPVGALAGTSPGGGWRCGADEAGAGHLIPLAFGGNNTAGPIDVATALQSHGGPHGRQDFASETFIAHAPETAPTMKTSGDAHSGFKGEEMLVAFNITPSNSNKDFNARASHRAQALTAGGNRPSARGGDLIAGSAVRRLTPRECERLQGFGDDYTLVPYRKGMMADGPRYKALGNSMAVPVMRWIGERIQAVEALV